MGYGEGGYGVFGYGQDAPSVQTTCVPLLRGINGSFWILNIDSTGELVFTSTDIPIAHYQGPLLSTTNGKDVWQLSIDDTVPGQEDIIVTKVTPPTIQPALPYIPFVSPVGGAWKLTVDPDGSLQTNTTDALLPGVIPYIPDVTMSVYGNNNPPLICTNCGNASVTASADLSLWCCSCNTFVPPEDTNIIVVLDE